jgi:hypothetical protein
MKWIPSLIGALAAAAGLIAGSHAVSAHHSSTMFDKSRIEILDGTVREVRWVNPHVTLLVFGTVRAGDEPGEWLLEMTSPGVLGRPGWKRTTFSPGDKVQARIQPLRDAEEHGGLLEDITSLATGRISSTSARMRIPAGIDGATALASGRDGRPLLAPHAERADHDLASSKVVTTQSVPRAPGGQKAQRNHRVSRIHRLSR